MPVLKGRVLRTIALALGSTLLLAPGAFADDPTDPPTVPEGDEALEQTIDPDQEIATDDVVLETGHIDLGPRHVNGDWTLMVHDDTQLEGSVWRPLDHTVVRVLDASEQQVPDDPAYSFLGVDPGTSVHVVPQTQNLDVAWLGWNTQDPSVLETVDRGVTLRLEGAEGPGDLVVYLQDGGFGEPDVLWDSRNSEPQELWVEVNTHTHANWVFTKPGVHLISITAVATLVDGTEQSTTGTLRMAVGDGADTDEALRAEVAAGTDDETGREGVASEAEEDSDGGMASWGWVVVAGAAVLLAGVVLAVLRSRRTRARALTPEADAGSAPEPVGDAEHDSEGDR